MKQVLKSKAHTEDDDGKSPHPTTSTKCAATAGDFVCQQIIQKSEKETGTEIQHQLQQMDVHQESQEHDHKTYMNGV